MKRTILLVGLALMGSTMLFAQKSNVAKTKNLLYQEPVDYPKAMECIEKAKMDSTTAKESKTWYWAGRIGYSMVDKEIDALLLQQQPNIEEMYTGLDMMYNNYIVADKYDAYTNKKGKIKYYERSNMRSDFEQMHGRYANVGGDMFNIQEFDKAYTMFIEYCAIADLEMFDEKHSIKVDSVYNNIKYYAALAAARAEKPENAIPLLKEIAAASCKESLGAYQVLAEQYLATEDTTSYVATMTEAVAKFPNDPYFVGSLVNFYVQSAQPEKAMDYIDAEITRNPKNIEYMNVKASLLAMQMQKFEEARKVLEQALTIDPNNLNSMYEMGRAWAFEGDHIQEVAQELTDNDAYNKEVARAKEYYKNALKYYEPLRTKLAADSPIRYDLLQNMKVLYLRLEDTAKYAEVNAEMQDL